MPIFIESWEKQLVLRDDHQILLPVQPLDIIQKLWELKYINRRQRDEFLRIDRSARKDTEKFQREDAKAKLLNNLVNETTYEQFVEALFKAKHHESALELELTRRHEMLSIVRRVDDAGPGFERAQKIYLDTKVRTHKNVYENPTQACQENYETYKMKFRNCEERLIMLNKSDEIGINQEEKESLNLEMMEYANICASCLCATLDAEITRWNKDFYWNEHMVPTPKNRLVQLFNELYSFINKTPNPKIAGVGFFSRLAIAYAMTGNLEKADEYIEIAFASSLHIPKCAELEFMLHMYLMILLFKYQTYPTDLLFKKL